MVSRITQSSTVSFGLLPWLYLIDTISFLVIFLVVMVHMHATTMKESFLTERGECNAGSRTTLCFCLAVNSFYHLVSTALNGLCSALSSFLSHVGFFFCCRAL